jgi:NADH-quinone oxidoreductase subunit G
MAKVTVDGIEVEVANGSSVLQACEAAGVEIPRFCYHERLSVAGNCRMCLVEVEKAPKPIASCSYPIADGMVVKTDSPMVRNGRRGVMEFLLINHPLDCPICDQGGECDLQDQAYSYGQDHSRYAENKRAVKDKNLGPLVKTIMTRCIQCTRCVRFATEIAGVPELGATARGESMEITTYVEKALTSELSGNLIDICPVGALTSKPYAFVARPWELRKTDSIDALDAVGSAIRVDARGAEVLRILPRENDEVNEEWLGDKSRFSFDGLKRRRLDKPWLRENGKLRPATWPEAFGAIAAKMDGLAGDRIGAIAGDMCDAESMLALKDLMASAGSANLDCRQDGARLDAGRRDFYLFNTTIAGIEEADALLIIGSNPRHEAPVLNARIRKRKLAGGFPIGVIGTKSDLTYSAEWLGEGPATIASLPEGFAKALADAKRPMIIVGQGALARADGSAVLAAAWKLAGSIGALSAEWHGFNVLHTAAARVGAMDLGFLPGPGGKTLDAMMGGGVDLLWLLGADEFDTGLIGADTFVVYQGHHGDRGAARADVILPGSTYVEKPGTYVNTEGRVQRAGKATFAPGDAREDWAILRAFSAVINKPLPYDDLDALRARLELVNPVFSRVGFLPRFGASDASGPVGDPAAVGAGAFVPAIADYYQTNPISRASAVMAECTQTYAVPAPTPVMAAE